MQPLTLYGFHHAGGAAHIYRPLTTHLPSWISAVFLDLPGHGRRRADAALTDWDAVITDVSSRISTAHRFAFFGHSMGGLLALRLAHRLSDAGYPPLWLGLAACRPGPRTDEPDWLTCPRETVLARLRELGGTPPEILAQDSLLDIILPVMRADLALCAASSTPAAQPLPLPVTAIGGTADDIPEAALTGWVRETKARFSLRMIDSDHFFPLRAAAATAAVIADEISRALAP